MILDLLQAVTGLFVVVYDGQHALKFTLGRAKNVVGPGVHFKWPIVQKFQVENTKFTTLDLEPQVIQLKDDLVYEVGAKVVYQIVDLKKAVIEVDDLVEGLRNRLVLIVQPVVKSQTRETISDLKSMIARVLEELLLVEDQWGVKIHEFGFSTFSPTAETLEVTQLSMLAEEKRRLFGEFRAAGISTQAAVSLISGAVMAVQDAGPEDTPPDPWDEPPPPSGEEDPFQVEFEDAGEEDL